MVGKIALITDMHFGVRNDSKAFLDYQAAFYQDVFFPYLEQHGIKHVIDLGDTFDRRKYVNFVTLKRAQEMWFDECEARGIELHTIVGNHCAYYRTTNAVNSNELLQHGYEGQYIYEEPALRSVNGLKIQFMPWINAENYDKCKSVMETPQADICMGHFEFAGFEMDKGVIADDGLNASIVDDFDLVLSGHYHHKSSRGHVHYLGSPYEMTWADYNDPRGFHILDTETRKLEFIQNPYTMFHKVYYDDSEAQSADDVLSMIEDPENYRGRVVKVIVQARENAYWFEQFLNKLYGAEPADMKIADDHFNQHFHDEEEDVQDIENAEVDDTFSAMKKYIDNLGDLNVSKKELEKEMYALYKEALTVED